MREHDIYTDAAQRHPRSMAPDGLAECLMLMESHEVTGRLSLTAVNGS